MKLIESERLTSDIHWYFEDKCPLFLSDSTFDDICGIIDNQPEVFIGNTRTCGKKLTNEYLAMREVLENHGIDSSNPVENLNFVLNQYQKVMMSLTGGLLSKLCYDADFVISHIVDRLESD